MWKPSHYELLQSNIIDKVVDGDEFSPSDLYTWKDLKKLESDLLNIKIYQVIKTYEPNEFNKILKIPTQSLQVPSKRFHISQNCPQIVCLGVLGVNEKILENKGYFQTLNKYVSDKSQVKYSNSY